MHHVFTTAHIATQPLESAPDGSEVRVLLRLSSGGMAHFELGAGKISYATVHRSVQEIWFVLSGTGEMWRTQGDREEIIILEPGVCLTIPHGVHFQFRAAAGEPVAAIGVTMPPWPGDGEATRVTGPWEPSGL